jgi:hypothetical protein
LVLGGGLEIKWVEGWVWEGNPSLMPADKSAPYILLNCWKAEKWREKFLGMK